MSAFIDGLMPQSRGQLYRDMTPSLDLKEFFNGPIEGCGMIQDRFGRVTARFLATMDCQWDGEIGLFDEVFTYVGDGCQQCRTWKVHRIGPNYFEAHAHDILGVAQGYAFGNALQWRYRMDVPLDGPSSPPGDPSMGADASDPRASRSAKKPRSIRLSFDDWMWALSDDLAFNRSTMTKFGIKVAELSCAMRKVRG